jgi:dTDP-4-dehydrorhamnose 3,5-epimerase-like enzyme
MWNDPTIQVEWPIPEGSTPNISEKDGKHPLFSQEIALEY